MRSEKVKIEGNLKGTERKREKKKRKGNDEIKTQKEETIRKQKRKIKWHTQSLLTWPKFQS